MNLDSCTPFQREIITTLDCPLMVAAGAGSGKTFTLTNRLVYALLPGSGQDGKALVDDLSEVLVTTFTNKAAAELKARIKALLAEEGLSDQALKVDAAWISTIHGICGHILRENALVFNLDPQFSVLDEAQGSGLFHHAFVETIDAIREEDATNGHSLYEGAFGVLFSRYDAGTSTNVSELEALVRTVREKAKASVRGLAGLVFPSPTRTPQELLREMIVWAERYQAQAASWQNSSATDQKHLTLLGDALSRAHAYLEHYGALTFTDTHFPAEEFADAFYAFPPTSAKYRAAKEDADFFEAYRFAYAQLADEVEKHIVLREIDALINLVKRVDAAYQKKKGPARLDNTDLLSLTAQGLARNPDIAVRYQNRFKLIMVDEFQDTDDLQVQIVCQLAKPDRSNICTVGDAQQSIYRFRGADVSVFRAFRQETHDRYTNTKLVTLPDNFRSHADVLQFVDKVFSHPALFGDDFLSLRPAGAINQEHDAYLDEQGRIYVELVEGSQRGMTRDTKRYAAQQIAKHFARLRKQGVSPGDMALLLRNLKQVDIYLDALREQGFECLISGGSEYAGEDEVKLVESLCHWCVNPFDSRKLYHILSSALFAFTDEALLALTTRSDDTGQVRTADLARMFHRTAPFSADTAASRQIERARMLLKAFLADQDTQGLARAVERLVLQSGLLSRLEREGALGYAKAGNLLKVIRQVEQLEAITTGSAALAEELSSQLAASKESPGVLATDTSQFVQIMTVHASKGLEFDHVAVGEFPSSSPVLKGPRIDADAAGVHISLAPSLAEEPKKVAKKLSEYLASDIPNASEEYMSYRQMTYRAKQQDHEEEKRLLYVAFTRAVKSLMFTFSFTGNKANDYANKGLLGELHEALQWDISDESSQQMLAFAPGRYCHFTHTRLTESFDGEVHRELNEPLCFVWQAQAEHTPAEVAFQPLDESVCSYTALSAVSPHTANSHASVRTGLVPDQDGIEASSVDLGLAFHYLAQRGIERFRAERKREALVPPVDTKEYLARTYHLDDLQVERVQRAYVRWIQSEAFSHIASFESIGCEVPFFVQVPNGTRAFFLEGEIDLLAYNNRSSALLVDYKTGGSDTESDADLHAKHLLQAQCYAYALLREGFHEVRAQFVRIERTLPETDKPQMVTYHFTQADKAAIEAVLCEHYHLLYPHAS